MLISKSKNSLLSTTVAIAAVLGLASVITEMHASAAESIIYTGSEGQLDNGWLYPANSLSGNTVSVIKTTENGDYVVPDNVYASISFDPSNNDLVDNELNLIGYAIVRTEAIGAKALGFLNNGAVSVDRNNVVITDDARVSRSVRGGQVESTSDNDSFDRLSVSNNSVKIMKNARIGSVDQAGITATISGGDARIRFGGEAVLLNNKVSISGNAIVNPYAIYGASADITDVKGVTVAGNKISIGDNAVIREGTSPAKIYAGYVFENPNMRDGASSVLIFDNSAEVSGHATVLSSIMGGSHHSYNANGGTILSIKNNNVTVKDNAIVKGSVYAASIGGYSVGSAVIEGNSVDVFDNTSISGNIYGGFVNNMASTDYFKVNNNIVTLSGDNINLQGSDYFGNITYSHIYGGFSTSFDDDKDNLYTRLVAGNTLNLVGYKGTVGGIHNFEYYNWIAPDQLGNGEVLISVVGDDPVDLSGTKHTITIENDRKRSFVGDKIILIDKATGVPVSVPDKVQEGQFIIYDVDVKVDENDQFSLTVKGKSDLTPPEPEEGGRINPRTKALSEGRAAALGLVNENLIATAGIDSIRMMARQKDSEQGALAFLPFLITKGTSNKYKSGSYADVKGFHVAGGIAAGAVLEENHKVTLGAFYEYGRGTYDTYNSFANYASVRADGDTHYTGGGIFGRLEVAGTGLGRTSALAFDKADGLYAEASVRGGRISMAFDSDDLVDGEGYRANYKSKMGYWGGHAGLGYVFNVEDSHSIDVYGRYLWTYMKDDTVTVGKDQLDFDSALSSRMQIGGRYNYSYNEQFKPYIGAAYEYEFDGSISASAYKLRLDEPSLKGGTGIVETGFTFTPNVKVPDLSISMSGQAYFGQRRGGSGEVKLKYQF